MDELAVAAGDEVSQWSWEENKLFEVALAVVEEEDPNRWEVVAAMVGGNKSAEEVYSHYVILLQDLEIIESGKLDYKLSDDAAQFYNSSTQSISWTDEDHKYLTALSI